MPASLRAWMMRPTQTSMRASRRTTIKSPQQSEACFELFWLSMHFLRHDVRKGFSNSWRNLFWLCCSWKKNGPRCFWAISQPMQGKKFRLLGHFWKDLTTTGRFLYRWIMGQLLRIWNDWDFDKIQTKWILSVLWIIPTFEPILPWKIAIQLCEWQCPNHYWSLANSRLSHPKLQIPQSLLPTCGSLQMVDEDCGKYVVPIQKNHNFAAD